jgi:hypothetical protein
VKISQALHDHIFHQGALINQIFKEFFAMTYRKFTTFPKYKKSYPFFIFQILFVFLNFNEAIINNEGICQNLTGSSNL